MQEFAGQYELAAMDMRGYGESDAPKVWLLYSIMKSCVTSWIESSKLVWR